MFKFFFSFVMLDFFIVVVFFLFFQLLSIKFVEINEIDMDIEYRFG